MHFIMLTAGIYPQFSEYQLSLDVTLNITKQKNYYYTQNTH